MCRSGHASPRMALTTHDRTGQHTTRRSHMSARKWYLTLVLALALIASACGPAATPTPTEPPAALATQPPAPPTEPPPTEPPARKVATFIWTQEFDTLNPQYTNMWFSAITQQFWNCWPWV